MTMWTHSSLTCRSAHVQAQKLPCSSDVTCAESVLKQGTREPIQRHVRNNAGKTTSLADTMDEAVDEFLAESPETLDRLDRVLEPRLAADESQVEQRRTRPSCRP